MPHKDPEIRKAYTRAYSRAYHQEHREERLADDAAKRRARGQLLRAERDEERRLPAAERFWAKVNKSGPVPAHRPELGPCWVWEASKNKGGYGQFQLGRATGSALAHRFAWAEAHGEPDLCVLHKCDNPVCVRVSHLFLGTIADNNRDMSNKGRGYRLRRRCGEQLHHAKLKEEDVALIRLAFETLPVTQHDIAVAWGITKEHVWAIVHRRTWRHVA